MKPNGRIGNDPQQPRGGLLFSISLIGVGLPTEASGIGAPLNKLLHLCNKNRSTLMMRFTMPRYRNIKSAAYTPSSYTLPFMQPAKIDRFKNSLYLEAVARAVPIGF